MSKRPNAAALFLFLLPVGVGTGILGSYTVGASLHPHNPAPLGIALALITVALLSWFMYFSDAPKAADGRFGSVLVVCGTLCVLAALALQFHLAWLVAENSRSVSVILRERGGNVNMHVDFPDTIKGISYLALFAGLWLIALGIRVAVDRDDKTPPVRMNDAPPTSRFSPAEAETGFRPG